MLLNVSRRTYWRWHPSAPTCRCACRRKALTSCALVPGFSVIGQLASDGAIKLVPLDIDTELDWYGSLDPIDIDTTAELHSQRKNRQTCAPAVTAMPHITGAP